MFKLSMFHSSNEHQSSINNDTPSFDLTTINQKISFLLNTISHKINLPLSLLVYSYDTENSNDKMDVFEISFDNFKYFNSNYSILLDSNYSEISKYLWNEMNLRRSRDHLNFFVSENIEHNTEQSFNSPQFETISLLQLLHQECLKLKNIEKFTPHHYVQYSLNNIYTSEVN